MKLSITNVKQLLGQGLTTESPSGGNPDSEGADHPRKQAAHALEPWSLCHHLRNDSSCTCSFPGDIWGADGEHVVCTMGSFEVKGQEGMSPPRYDRLTEVANAQRIVRCINACAGISDEDLDRQIVYRAFRALGSEACGPSAPVDEAVPEKIKSYVNDAIARVEEHDQKLIAKNDSYFSTHLKRTGDFIEPADY